MFLYLLRGSYGQTYLPSSTERFIFSRLPYVFEFSLERPMSPTRAAVTGKAFGELAI